MKSTLLLMRIRAWLGGTAWDHAAKDRGVTMYRRTATGCALAIFAVLVSACSSVVGGSPRVVAGSPRVVGEGPPIHGQPVSSLDRAEVEIAAAARAIDPCLALDSHSFDGLGAVIAYGPVGDLSTCHAEIVPPSGSPATPDWLEVNIGVLEPTAELGLPQVVAGTEVRGPALTMPGSCALYFPLAPYLSLGQQVPGVTQRWGYVSHLGDGASDCVAARTVTESVLGRLEHHDAVGGDRSVPLAEQDPCRVVESLDKGVETFGSGSRPFECRIGLEGGVPASVAFALTPPPETSESGLDEVVLGNRRFLHFQDAMACNYYFYPGEVFDTEQGPGAAVPDTSERSRTRLTAAVTASAANCADAEVLATAAAVMFDY